MFVSDALSRLYFEAQEHVHNMTPLTVLQNAEFLSVHYIFTTNRYTDIEHIEMPCISQKRSSTRPQEEITPNLLVSFKKRAE